MLKYIGLWFPMLIIAIANGFLREAVFKKVMSNLTAHQASTVSLVIFFAFYIWFVIWQLPPHSENEAILIGIVWVIMTLIFEFGFGRWRGNSWESLFEDYNIVKGRIWVLIPIWVAVAPYIFYRSAR